MEELHPSQQAEERIACDSVIAPGDFDLWDVPTTTLLVRFMEEIKQNENQLEMPEHAIQKQPCAGKWGLTAEQILQWANRWSTTPKLSAHAGDKNFIPKFELAKGRETPHIVVVLNERGKNFTIYGKHQGSIEQPNMWLDLSIGDDRHKQHLVVHEFGHALGLGHEHQRPDFWKLIEPFVNKKMMERDTGASCYYWKMDKDLKVKKGTATRYDSKSVMHYWFMKEWLIDGYKDKRKIEEDCELKVLTKKEKEALMAVHDCDRRVATEPSAKDLEFLNKIYRSKKIRPTCA